MEGPERMRDPVVLLDEPGREAMAGPDDPRQVSELGIVVDEPVH